MMNTLYAHDGYLNTFMRMRTAAAQRTGPVELGEGGLGHHWRHVPNGPHPQFFHILIGKRIGT